MSEGACRGEEGRCPSPGIGGLCWGHRKVQQRKGDISRPLSDTRRLTPKAKVLEAFFALEELDATDRAGWNRAWNRLRMAMRRYVLAEKRNDPRRRAATD